VGVEAVRRANPKLLAKTMKTGGGVLSLGVAALLMMRGRLDMAIFIGGLGAWLLGWSAVGRAASAFPGAMEPGRARRRARARRSNPGCCRWNSTMTAAAMTGTVRAGTFAGRDTRCLSLTEISALMRECLAQRPGRRPPARGISRPPVARLA
jgi:hypothetical protein